MRAGVGEKETMSGAGVVPGSVSRRGDDGFESVDRAARASVSVMRRGDVVTDCPVPLNAVAAPTSTSPGVRAGVPAPSRTTSPAGSSSLKRRTSSRADGRFFRSNSVQATKVSMNRESTDTEPRFGRTP